MGPPAGVWRRRQRQTADKLLKMDQFNRRKRVRSIHTSHTRTTAGGYKSLNYPPHRYIYILVILYKHSIKLHPSNFFLLNQKKKGKVFYCHCSDSRETISEENKTFAGCIFYRTCSAIPFGQVARSNIVQFTLR